jgi:glycine betaine/proline transport system substrate-binding protein
MGYACVHCPLGWSGADLDESIYKAYERKAGWLGYYWSPKAIMGRYEMQKLDMGVEHDQMEWQRCTVKSDCANPQPNKWRKAVVMTVTSAKVAKDSLDAFAYLSKRAWPNSVVSELLVYMDENRVGGDEAAEKFLKEHEELWHLWVPLDVLQKIKAVL